MPGQRLKLSRPLVALDLETTGLDVARDRIVEICCVKLRLDGTRETRTRRIDPQMPIPPEASRVHGISDADVQGEPTFPQVARSLGGFLARCDLTGFNLERFDLPILAAEFERASVSFSIDDVHVVDSFRIFSSLEPRNLTAAYRFYLGEELERAHSAEADAMAAADILIAQVERYQDLPDTVEGLGAWRGPNSADWLDPDGRIGWQGGKPVLLFGKHRGRSLADLADQEPGYLRWMLDRDFAPEVTEIVQQALSGELPSRGE